MRVAVRLICGILLTCASAWPSSAENSAPFYQGKTLRILISAGVAGGYAEYARTLAAHMPDHLPGKPDMIMQSMPGAGGLLATNYLFNTAPQDGTTIGLIHSSVPLAPLFGTKGARFDALKFHWIGSLDRSDGPCTSWYTSPIKTWDDMLHKEFIVGSSGVGSQMDIYPAVMNKLFGTKIKVIGGYHDGGAIFQAMERGEVQGRCGPQITAIKSLRPQWFTEHKVVIPIMFSERRSTEFPDAPSIMEFAKDEATRQQVRLLIVSQDLDRPVLAPPGVPPQRVKVLREAFDATMNDPAFRADIKRLRLTLDWVGGEKVTKTLANAYAMPPAIVEAAGRIMAGK